MTTTEPITDFYKRILGYIETDSYTGVKTATNFYRQILGYYYPNENVTKDFYKRIVGHGDLTSALIFQNNNNTRL